METLIINGGKVLQGSVEINGAKNAAVAILPAAILAAEGKCIIDNIPYRTQEGDVGGAAQEAKGNREKAPRSREGEGGSGMSRRGGWGPATGSSFGSWESKPLDPG